MRGKDVEDDKSLRTRRITPACAGKSGCKPEAGKCGQDHPRVCGEKWTGVKRGLCALGSPPRVRGKGVLPYY